MGGGVLAADAIGNGARTVNTLRLAGIGLSVAIALGLASTDRTWAIDASDALTDPDQRAAYEKIINEVRCLVCQNQTIADSSAPLAADLRREIRNMVEEGNSETDIKVFLVERYGDFVLYRPRVRSWTLALWLAPFAFLIVGGLTLYRVVQRRRSLPIDQDAPLADE
jgi:cytochrome c-type biogenesis protein CcmH